MEFDSFYRILFFLSSHFRYKFFFADDYEAVVNVHFPSKEEGIEYFWEVAFKSSCIKMENILYCSFHTWYPYVILFILYYVILFVENSEVFWLVLALTNKLYPRS